MGILCEPSELDDCTPVPHSATCRIPDRAGQPEGPVTGELLVDTNHSFFFDHRLDHVPGMLQVCGLFDLLSEAGSDMDGVPGRRLRLSLRFTSFCTLQPPPILTATRLVPQVNDLWSVDVRQHGSSVCAGRIDVLSGTLEPPPSLEAGTRGSASAPAEVVHRHRPENIMIGAARTEADEVVVPVMVPARNHYLRRLSRDAHDAAALIEAGRQFTTMLGLMVTGMPVDSHLVWLTIAADLPLGIPHGTRLWLRWLRMPDSGPKVRFVMDLLDADRRRLGMLVSSCLVLNDADYTTLRTLGGQR
ncbi:AfsA-related hotdog domain-containing protein [Streptomyces chartreusis]